MKLLVLTYEKDAFKLFSDIFAQESKFFEVTYSNFWLEKQDFDVILAEDSEEKMKDVDIPILLLKNSRNINNPNFFVLKDCSAKHIRKTLKQMYEIPRGRQSIENVEICTKPQNLAFTSKRVIFEFSEGENFLYNINESLKGYDISTGLIKKIGLILSEVLINTLAKKITSIFEFLEEKICLIIPHSGMVSFSIGAFCDLVEKTAEGLRLTLLRERF